MTKVAVLIGNRTFPKSILLPLRCPEKDVEALTAVLKQVGFIVRTHKRTPDTVWQLLSQLSDFIGIKNRHCEL